MNMNMTLKAHRILKTAAILTAVLASQWTTSAQEILSREEAMKYAVLAALNEPAPAHAPIRVDADLKRPFVAYDGEYGVLILPETKLSASALEGVSADVIPIGQIWLRGLAPMVDGSVVEASKLQIVSVSHEGESLRVPLCLLGVRKAGEGRLELLVYGKGKEPVARLPLNAGKLSQTLPIEMTAERDSDSGRIQLRVLGKYEATLTVTELAE